MRTLELTPPKLIFMIGTRAALGVGVGLLLSTKLSEGIRKRVGLGLALVGAVTTIPAALMLRAAAH